MNVETKTFQMNMKRKIVLSKKMEAILVKKNTDLTKLKSNVEISFTNKQNEYCTTKVISRAGKSTWKYRACYILTVKLQIIHQVYKDGLTLKRSNITIIPTQSQQPEISNSESIYSVIEVFETQSISNENAKQNELTSWKENHVDESMQNKNQFCSSLCWVC